MKITSRLLKYKTEREREKNTRRNSNFFIRLYHLCIKNKAGKGIRRHRRKKVFLCLHYAVGDVVSARLGYPPGNNIVFCWFSVFDFSRSIWFDCFFLLLYVILSFLSASHLTPAPQPTLLLCTISFTTFVSWVTIGVLFFFTFLYNYLIFSPRHYLYNECR